MSTITLPAGWTTRHNPTGHLGANIVLLDADGERVGSYGHLGHSQRGGAPLASPWEACGRHHTTEAQAIATLIHTLRPEAAA